MRAIFAIKFLLSIAIAQEGDTTTETGGEASADESTSSVTVSADC